MDDLDEIRPLLRRELFPLAMRRSMECLDEGRALAAAEFPGPALVWAVRSAEILVREALLMPVYYEQTGDLRRGFKRAREKFRDGWIEALRFAGEAYGVADAPRTDTEDHAWRHWNTHIVRARGEVVHGRAEVDLDIANWSIDYANQMREWWAVRIFLSERGPLIGMPDDLASELDAARVLDSAEADEESDTGD